LIGGARGEAVGGEKIEGYEAGARLWPRTSRRRFFLAEPRQARQKLVHAAIIGMFRQDKSSRGFADSRARRFVLQILANESTYFGGMAVTHEVNAFLKAQLG